ncbi:MAG: hypothetical protein KGQ93_14920 [Cyanobacteria bacterium REEB459]|nr:hypothetical protein [Cyanobacteria bacterium REEB459]
MIVDLIGATRAYWRQLDELESAYSRHELTPQEVDARVKQLMIELGQARRRALAEAWAIGQGVWRQQRETVAGVAAIGGLAYVWLVFSGQA